MSEMVRVVPLLISLAIAFATLFFGLKTAPAGVKGPLTAITIAQVISVAVQIATIHFRW